jgi:enoyl-CoA hydratase
VPELLVGVPFPPLALEIVRFAIPRHHLQSMVYLGRTIEAEEARTIGIIDEIVNVDGLMTRASVIAAQLASIAAEPFRITKRQIREPFLHDAARIAATSTEAIDTIWAEPETHERIKSYLAKTLGKRG